MINPHYISFILNLEMQGFALWHCLSLALISVMGVVIYEIIVEYAPDEDGYSIRDRRGELIGGSLFSFFITLFSPYFWSYIHNTELFGVALTIGWFNPLIAFLTGLTWVVLFGKILAYIKSLKKSNSERLD